MKKIKVYSKRPSYKIIPKNHYGIYRPCVISLGNKPYKTGVDVAYILWRDFYEENVSL